MRGYFVFPITTKYNESAGVPQNVVLVTCDSESEDLWNTILNKIFRVYQMENRERKKKKKKDINTHPSAFLLLGRLLIPVIFMKTWTRG